MADMWDGKIDILVNNAAAPRVVPSGKGLRRFDQWTVDEWDCTLDVNLRGMWFCARSVVPYMKPQGYGKIINLTSSTFFEGVPGFVPYVASKGGIIGLTRALSRELGEFGIRVNALAPGFTMTRLESRAGGRQIRPVRTYPLSPMSERPQRALRRPGGTGLLPRLAGQRFHDRPDSPGRRRAQHALTGERHPCELQLPLCSI